jgi:two-component system response regulator YesN
MKLLNLYKQHYKGYLKSKVFTKFILSYCIILAIPLCLIGVLLYHSLTGSLSDEVKKNTLLRISETVDNMNTRLREFNYIAVQLPQNPEANPLFYYKGKDSITQYQYYKIVEELNQYKSTNSFIENLSILYSNTEMIIGTQGKQTLEEFIQQNFGKENLNVTSFKDILNSIKDGTSATINLGYAPKILKTLIMYVKPIPMPDLNNKAYLVVTIDAFSVNKLLENSLGGYEGKALLLDEKGNTVTSVMSGNIPIEEDKIRSILKMEGNHIYLQNMHGQSDSIALAKSEDHQWNFLVVMPVKQIFAKVNHLKIYSLVLILLSIFIGILVAYYFAYGNYNPIKKLVDILSVNTSGQGVASNRVYYDELDMIGNRLVEILYQDKEQQGRLKQYIPVVKSNFLNRLLKGDFRNHAVIKEMADFLGIVLENNIYAVMIFNIDDYERFVKSHPEPVQALYKFAISNAVEELAQSLGHGYSVEDAEDRITLMIDFNRSSGNPKESMISIGQSAIEFFKKNFKFTLTVGIGGVYNNILEACKSYIEARAAIEYKMVKGTNTVILYDETLASRDGMYYYPLHQQSKIINCVKIGDFEGVKQVLSDLISKIKNKHISMESARCIYFEMVNSAMRVLSELDIDYSEIASDEGNVLPALLKCETLDQLYLSTVEFYKTLCEYIQELQEKKEKGFKGEVLEYFEQHCSDNEMSLTHLADKFGVTVSYLSRYFKKNTNSSFVDYLHHLRLARAKLILITSEKSVNDISTACGYIDSRTFITTFKKYEGMPPGKYREMYKEG